MRVSIRHRIEYLLGRSILFLVGVLPEKLAYGVAGALGQLYFRCSKRRRVCALRFLRNAYPDQHGERELLAIGRRSTGNIFKVPLDMMRVTRAIRKDRLGDVIDTSQARAMGISAPFVGITPHLGSWEMCAVAAALIWGEAHVIVRPFPNPLLTRFITESRRRTGLHLHPRRGGIRDLADAMRGGAVGLQAADQRQRKRGVLVPFFGEITSTERSAVTLALRGGYKIVVGRCERVGSGFRFRLILSEPYEPQVSADRQEDIRRATAEVNRRMEEHILACPEQYLWIHDRYRKSRCDNDDREAS